MERPGSRATLAAVPASTLADREAARRNAARALGPCGSGSGELDDYVLMGGGFERGSIVGISGDDEGFGLVLGIQVLYRAVCDVPQATALVITPRPTGVVASTLSEIVADTKCLHRILLARIFDLDGLAEVLTEVETTPQRPVVILVTHFSLLLTSLFAQRPQLAAHATLRQLGLQTRRLARAVSAPLILLLNTTRVDPVQPPADPTLRSIFRPAFARPAFGLVFAQLLDLHLLCTPVPRASPSSTHRPCTTVVEVLLDDAGLWLGVAGPRPCREQRWAALDLVDGRVVDAFPTPAGDRHTR